MAAVEFVDLYWDINTCPAHYPVDNLVTNIEKALRQVRGRNPNAPIYRLSQTRLICGNVQNLNEDTKTRLVGQGFTLVNAEERHAYCVDHHQRKPSSLSPELLLETRFIEVALRHNLAPGSRNILLISNDYDFAYSLEKFINNGYTVFLAYMADMNNICPYFKTYAHYTWIWEWMESIGGGILGE